MRKLATTGIAAFVVALLAGCDGGGASAPGGDGGGPGTTDGGDGSQELVRRGDMIPEATITDCDAEPLSLQEWIGRHDVAYVTFGAVWCTACKEEAPIINEDVVARFEGESVGVAQVLVADQQPGEPPRQELCTEWRDRLDAEFTVWVDADREMVAPYFGEQAGELPAHMIVQRDGTIRFFKVGAIPDDIGDRIGNWLPGQG